MIRRFPLIAEPGEGEDRSYLTLRYRYQPSIYWKSENVSSETAVVTVAVLIAKLVTTESFELGIATLADACETGRHLFLFHVLTDITICFAAVVLFRVYDNRVRVA